MVWETISNYLFGSNELQRSKNEVWYEENYEKMKSKLLNLMEGRDTLVDQDFINNLDSIPDWVDKDKIIKGQEFGRKYFYAITLTELMSVYLLLSVEEVLRPLIFTNKTSTVDSAFERYFSTTVRMYSWYHDDILDVKSEARKHIDTINKMHCTVSSQISSKTDEDYTRLSKLENRLKEPIWTSGCPLIRDDLKELTKREMLNPTTSKTNINQYVMALTQYAFMGITVVYPEKLSVYASQNEMESFMHFWRYLGYLLGIEDKYNLCIGSYEEVIFNCKTITELVYKPSLAHVSPEWEHMSHSVCNGLKKHNELLHFESTVAILLYVYDLNADQYYKRFSWRDKCSFYYFYCICKFAWLDVVRNQTNNFVISRILTTKEKYRNGNL